MEDIEGDLRYHGYTSTVCVTMASTDLKDVQVTSADREMTVKAKMCVREMPEIIAHGKSRERVQTRRVRRPRTRAPGPPALLSYSLLLRNMHTSRSIHTHTAVQLARGDYCAIMRV